jgi:hypothetical protein
LRKLIITLSLSRPPSWFPEITSSYVGEINKQLHVILNAPPKDISSHLNGRPQSPRSLKQDRYHVRNHDSIIGLPSGQPVKRLIRGALPS